MYAVARTEPESGIRARGYRHEALLYEGCDELAEAVVAFVYEGLLNDEPTLVMLPAAKLALVRNAIGADADAVHYADAEQVGRNPARIIPVFDQFAREHGGAARVRAFGESIGRRHAGEELVERHHHEMLLNHAFAGAAMTVVCAYDVGQLHHDVIGEARRTHPLVCHHGSTHSSVEFERAVHRGGLCHAPLPEPPPQTQTVVFTLSQLHELRAHVSATAARLGLSRSRIADLVVAADELATNSVRHGGGSGRLRVWAQQGAVVCEVRDEGRISDQLAGRRRPDARATASRGLWLANQLCDLVQLRAFSDGGAVRLHMRLA
jgi:anti-sigma regulatory factor (Ser/Thr protein kinase)